jgi:antiviral defense system Shedu protein SduA
MGLNEEHGIPSSAGGTILKMAQLVSNCATERQLQIEVKRDLSIMGTAHADPKDEYIAFSEFPVGSRPVDAVLFTGRSKMEVVMVEVKGADFTFLKNNNKRAWRINDGVQQIEERFVYVKSNYQSFLRESHSLRKFILAAGRKYNSTVGPKGLPYVDPGKEIYLLGVVIGGRTKDDIREINNKWQFENRTAKITLESWDSWLRKYHLGSRLPL